MASLLATEDSWALTAARLALGIVMFPHGTQKMLGWFGGYGFSGTMGFFISQGMPAPLAFLVIAAEFFGSPGLIVGLLGRVAALGVVALMVGAILIVHQTHGFFMNWEGKQPGEGFEYHLLAIGLGLTVLIGSSGALSLDRLLSASR
jgi:putative oxidoreductase